MKPLVLDKLPLPHKGPRAKSRFLEMKRLLCNGIIQKPRRKGHGKHPKRQTPREHQESYDRTQQRRYAEMASIKGVHTDNSFTRMQKLLEHRTWWRKKLNRSIRMCAIASDIWMMERKGFRSMKGNYRKSYKHRA